MERTVYCLLLFLHVLPFICFAQIQVQCPEEEVAHGRLTYLALDGSSKRTTPVHGDTRRLRCNSGYESTNFISSHCDNGVWVNEGAESLSCLPMSSVWKRSVVGCVVPHIENARIDTFSVATQQVILAGNTVRIVCNSGYYLRESGSHPTVVELRCLSSSSWDKAKPVCVPQTCTVDRLFTGDFPERRITYNHDENITFTCNPGYEQEYESYWCDRGTALPANPRCVQASCHAPDLPDHMISSQSRFAHGSLLSVSCEHGFRLSANQQQPRCWEGEWTRSLDVTCQRVSCPEPGSDSLHTVEALSIPGIQGYVHGARIRYSCIEGWEILGIAERECDSGHWTGSPPECRIAAHTRCRLPERSNGERYYVTGYTGNIFDEGLPFGESVHISVRCNPGYLPQSAVSTTCLNRGVWSVRVPICVRMQRLCSKPGYISHVVQYVNGLEINELTSYPHDELPEGTFMASHCSLPGQYVLQGSANRTCFEGRWTGTEPRCVASETQITFYSNQPLEIRSDGTIVIFPRSYLRIDCRMPSNSNKAAYFSSDSGVFASYISGYGPSFMAMTLNPPRTSQSGRFTCRSYDNSLSHSVFIQFTEIHCDQPFVPTNGELHDYDSGWRSGRYYMGKVITYTCNRGYSLDGERRIKCVFGQWSDRVPRCRRATCPELQPPTHGTKIGGNRIGDSVMIGCNYGYQLQGETFLDCLESGEWSHPLPNCTVTPEIAQPRGPCDLVTCEVWQKCLIDSSNVGVCRCISPYDCPETEEPGVCGTDGRNYTSICHLKALACLWNTGVDVASSDWFCINGIPERTQAPPTFPTNFNPDELSSSSSFDDYVLGVNPDATSIPEPTLPANSGPVEPDTSPSRQPVDVDPRSYLFCDTGVCPADSSAELWCSATAIVIAFAVDWQAELGILTVQIYEVMSGELPSWTENSDQEVLIDDGGVSERGCICPTFQSDEPVIIRFSQNLRPDEKGQLLGTDVVLPYSVDLYQQITRILQEAVSYSLEYLRKGLKNASVYIGEDHTFECSPQESTLSVSWEKDGQRLYSHVSAGSNLMLKDIEQEDEGLYTCIVRDCRGQTKIRADAWLYVTPKIDISKVCGTITFWKEKNNLTTFAEEMTITQTDVDDTESSWRSSFDNAAGRIVGGHETKNGSAPYMVGIWKRQNSVDWTFHCGASLLDQMWIMTAAHCMFDTAGTLRGKEELRLIFGDLDTLTTDVSEETRKPSEIIVHEEFNKKTLDNDIALIRIEPPLREFTPYIRPICLAPVGLFRNLTKPGTFGRVTGWGQLSSEGAFSTHLRTVELPVVNRKTCRGKDEKGQELTDNMFCAGYPEGGLDACGGDSGSPFAVHHNDGRWYQVGIVSSGDDCAQLENYGIYTRVSCYLQWIHSKNVTVAYSPQVGRQLNENKYSALVFRAIASSYSSDSEDSGIDLKSFPSVDDRSVQRYNESNQAYKPCGEAGNVLNGDDHQANEKAWPWLSRIHRNSATGSQMMCSGTLICQQWVLTTSSCFANIPDSDVIDEVLVTIGEDLQAMPEEITVTVTLGEYNVSIGEGCEQTIEVDRIILHEHYDRKSLHDYNIALLHLCQPVKLSSCIRTICLPSEMDTPHDPTVVGWGTASGLPENAHDVPLQYPMPLATQADCHRVNHNYDRFDVTDRMLCAGERLGTDVRCQGDNGSPLMYKRSGDEKWVVLGISTKGEKCSQYNRYGIFTRVDEEFTRWINTVTDDCFSDHIPTKIEL